MANRLDELAGSQHRTAEELRRLADELRRRSKALLRAEVSQSADSPSAGAIARAALPGTQRVSSDLPRAPDSAVLEATTSALRELAAGIKENTSALRTSASAAKRGLSGVAGGLLRDVSGGGGAFGLLTSGLGLAPLGSSILKLFGKRRQELEDLRAFEAPLPIHVSAVNGEGHPFALPRAVRGDRGNIRAVGESPTAAPAVVVNVDAMDSRSFMDRSGEIASAVREAMLHMHPVNDVVSEL